MLILPAIDLYHGEAVRLVRGDYGQMTRYNDDPLGLSRQMAAEGASWLHVVDLEGAALGRPVHRRLIAQLAAESGLRVELGGGIRDGAAVRDCLGAGVERVILGTAAATDEAFLRDMLDRYGEKIAVGADIRDGRIAVKGWKEVLPLTAAGFFEKLSRWGVRTVICTDISRDGLLSGANRALYAALKKDYPVDIIASGGVRSLTDILEMKALGLCGTIVGRAYYTGAIRLKDALEAAK